MNSAQELIDDIKQGKLVLLIDDEDRENEGDLVLAADYVTPSLINFMATDARGLICLALPGEQVDRLGLQPMVRDENNLSPNRTAFTVSIEAAKGVSTGISAADRAHTIKVASNPQSTPKDIIVPGHIFPIRAQVGGVLKRAGHTEGAVDLVRLAGLNPAAVICEIMNPDGTMARVPELMAFAKKHGIKVGTIVDLISHRLSTESFVEEVASAALPNQFGQDFRIRAFRNLLDGSEHVALQMGEIKPGDETLVRVHSECLTGDVFGSLRCDCGSQLSHAIEMIKQNKSGVVLYLRQEGRGIGLANKIKAYALQDKGMDTVDANLHLGLPSDARNYGIGSQILRAMGIQKLKLITNNPAKRIGLSGYGLEVVDRVPLVVGVQSQNISYMNTKRDKMGHLIDSSFEET